MENYYTREHGWEFSKQGFFQGLTITSLAGIKGTSSAYGLLSSFQQRLYVSSFITGQLADS
jgi:hypothetical protein